MKIILGADITGMELKNKIHSYLSELGFEIIDVSSSSDTFVEVTKAVTKQVLENITEHKGIIIDAYGAGPFMVAAKHKKIICAQLNDEHSAMMTRDHNNANVITLGSYIVGEEVARRICSRFAAAQYSGGRHQIRVDMLNKMC